MEPTANKILIEKYITGKPDALCVELAALQSAFVDPAFSSQHKQLTILRDEIKSLPAYNENASWNVDHFKKIVTEVILLQAEIINFNKQLESLNPNTVPMETKKIQAAQEKCQKCIQILIEYEEMLDKIVAKLEKASAGSEQKLLVEMAIEALRADAPPVPVTPSQAVQEPIIAPPPSSTVVAPSAPQQALPADTVQIQAQAPAVISSQAAPVPTVTTSSQAVPAPVPVITPATPSTVVAPSAPQQPRATAPAVPNPTLSPAQQQALDTLKKLSIEFFRLRSSVMNASPTRMEEKLSAIVQHLTNLPSNDLIAILESEACYSQYVPQPFLCFFINSDSQAHFLEIIKLIPQDHRTRVLANSFQTIEQFIPYWLNMRSRSVKDDISWELKAFLDDTAEKAFFKAIIRDMHHASFFLRTAPDYASFEKLFSVYVRHYGLENNSGSILSIFDISQEKIQMTSLREADGSLPPSVVKRFLELTDSNPDQRESFIEKMNEKIQKEFRKALTEFRELSARPFVAPKVLQETVTVGTAEENPGISPPKISTPGAGASPTSSNTIYWVMGAVLSAAIILSVLFANLLIAGCVAGGGLLTIGALWFFKTRSHGAEKVTPSSTALGDAGLTSKNGSDIDQNRAMIFTHQNGDTRRMEAEISATPNGPRI